MKTSRIRNAKVRAAIVKPGDLPIARVADRLGRSYSWVYTRRARIGRDNVYRYKGVIFIRPDGFDKLAVMSARSPKRGRPRGHASLLDS